jgi:hypothetical protein
MTVKVQDFVVRVKNIRIGERRSDKTHDDIFTEALHQLANTKILATHIYDCWFESKNFFLHKDWVEIIKKI